MALDPRELVLGLSCAKNPIAGEELDKNATSWGPIPTNSDLVDVSGAWECVFHT